MTIDTLGMTKIRHLQQIHDLKSYRNACRVVKQLSPYIHETYFEKEKVIYLNKEGRELIGSTKEMKKNSLMQHTLLANEIYLYFNCPFDWKREYTLEMEHSNLTGISFNGIGLVKKKVVSDAAFSRNGYLHLIEIDNKRDMADNRKKINNYLENMKPNYKLYIFTTTKQRKRKFEEWLKKRGEVFLFEEIK